MARKSSPCSYARTSANSMPCPRKTERYSPANNEPTSPRVRSSMDFTCLRISGVTGFVVTNQESRVASEARSLRNPHRTQHPGDHIVSGHVLGFGFEGEHDAMSQHVRGQCTDILRHHVGALPKEGMSPGCLSQRDGRARGSSESNQRLEIREAHQPGIAGGPHQIDDVVHHLLVHVETRYCFPRGED